MMITMRDCHVVVHHVVQCLTMVATSAVIAVVYENVDKCVHEYTGDL
jgi:hypothetical protein